jgi:MFS family permease
MRGNEAAGAKRGSLRALAATNFFLADVQTGIGPFIAAYLASVGWQAARVGYLLTLSGIIGVVLQTPAGALVDRIQRKRALLAAGTVGLAAGALMLAFSTRPWTVYAAQAMIGSAAPFLGPALAAITLGLVGPRLFDRQFGVNQSFNSAGNLAAAGAIALVSHQFGNRAIFFFAAALTVPTILSVLSIKGSEIDEAQASGGSKPSNAGGSSIVKVLLEDRALLLLLPCAFLFHLANAAMLPQLGEMLAHGSSRAAAPFMSACIAVTQLTITLLAVSVGRAAGEYGRKPLLLLGFGVLPVRAFLYTVVHGTAALIAVQLLDGVANVVFGVVTVLVVADRTRGTGRFNLVQGALGTAAGIGAALSTTLGGTLISHSGYRLSFLTLGAVALVAFLVLLLALPETRENETSNVPT